MNFKSRILVITALSLSTVLTQCKKDEILTESESSLSTTDTLASDSISSVDLAPTDSAAQIGPMSDDLKLAATGIISTSHYLVKSLPSGYVKDGSRDYTSYVQAAVSKYGNIVFPAFPILVNSTGIKIPSNRTITFPSGSEVRLKSTSTGTYNIFKITNASNVTLYSPNIKGDRYKHIGTGGEWGMGIGIYGSTNVKIYNARINSCWGDGIYLGQYDGRVNCKNIVIKDSQVWSNRRDGITIIGVDGLLIDNVYSGYNNAVSPYSGINFEPNNSNSQLKNIKINNSKTEKNRNGIQIVTHHMVKGSDKTIDITITNHKDTSSPRFPIKISSYITSGTLYGTINVVNPTFNKTAFETNQYLWLVSNKSTLKTVVSSPAIISNSGSTLSWSSVYNLLMKHAGGGSLKVIQ